MSCILQYEFVIWIYHMWITAAEFLLIHADPSYVKLVACVIMQVAPLRC